MWANVCSNSMAVDALPTPRTFIVASTLTWQMWIPLGLSSAAMLCDKLFRAAIAAACACCPAFPRYAAVAEVKMIVPHPRAAMCGETSFAMLKAPSDPIRHAISNARYDVFSSERFPICPPTLSERDPHA
jgi:hypothetical protein